MIFYYIIQNHYTKNNTNIMYLLNTIMLLLHSQIQRKPTVKSHSHHLFKYIDDLYDNISIPIITPIPIIDNNVTYIMYNDRYHKKLTGCDERYTNSIDDNIKNFIDNKILLNKIGGFFNNKKLLDRLIKIEKQRNETLNKHSTSNDNSILHHQYESPILQQIRQYNNDNRNKSELVDDIFAGGLLNDW